MVCESYPLFSAWRPCSPWFKLDLIEMLIGYVSDDKYVALADVLVEFINDQGGSWEARSRAGGSIHCELPFGEYLVTLAKSGFGSKRVRMRIPSSGPWHFRLLSDCLL